MAFLIRLNLYLSWWNSTTQLTSLWWINDFFVRLSQSSDTSRGLSASIAIWRQREQSWSSLWGFELRIYIRKSALGKLMKCCLWFLSSTKAFPSSYRSIVPLRQSKSSFHALIFLHSTAWPLMMPKKSGSMTELECWHQTASVKIVLHFFHQLFRLCWSYGTETTTSVSILRAFSWLIFV